MLTAVATTSHSAALRAPPPRAIPSAVAAATYFRTVVRMYPNRRAIGLIPSPASHATKISSTSNIVILRRAMPPPFPHALLLALHLYRKEAPGRCFPPEGGQ